MRFRWRFHRQNRWFLGVCAMAARLPESFLFVTVRICVITWAYISGE
jgi:hypothetical protein